MNASGAFGCSIEAELIKAGEKAVSPSACQHNERLVIVFPGGIKIVKLIKKEEQKKPDVLSVNS